MAFAFLAAAAAAVNVAEVPALEQSEPVERARMLITAGELDTAASLLRSRISTNASDIDAHFLLGIIAARKGSHAAAASHFRAALAVSPRQVRIRLELARALLLDGNLRAAFRHFQLAQAEDLPAPVRANINRFLAKIRDAKDWSYSFDFALAPDSNINNGTSAREAIIFGLPFAVGDEARQRSGTGIEFTGGLEYAPRLGPKVRLRMGAYANRREYRGSSYDDHLYNLYSGPRLQVGNFDISVLGSATRRYYGGKIYQKSLGGRLEATHYASATSAIDVALVAEKLTYPNFAAQDGTFLAAYAGFTRALTPVSSARASLGLMRHDAHAPSLSSGGAVFGLGYRRELSRGLGVEFRPLIAYVRYDERDPFFARQRADLTKELSVSLTHQRLALWRFTPRVTYRLARRSSTIDLFSYTQSRVEFGLTTDF